MAAMDTKLVCCLGEFPTWLPGETFESAAESTEWFDEPTYFTRWLFMDPCAAGVPQVPLVAGWREAKPCVQAIEAVRSGDDSKLRPDKGRPQLLGAVAAPIVDIVVVVEKSRQHAAKTWAAEHKYSFTIHVATSMPELSAAMEAVMSKVEAAPARRLPGLRVAAPPGLRRYINSRGPVVPAPPPGLEHPDGDHFAAPFGDRLKVAPPPGLAHPAAAKHHPTAALSDLGHPDAQHHFSSALPARLQSNRLASEVQMQKDLAAALEVQMQKDFAAALEREFLLRRAAHMALSNPGATLRTVADVSLPMPWAAVGAARAVAIPDGFKADAMVVSF